MQVVHYPLFDGLGEAEFAAYEVRHTRTVTAVIALPAPAEVVTAALLTLFASNRLRTVARSARGVLVVVMLGIASPS